MKQHIIRYSTSFIMVIACIFFSSCSTKIENDSSKDQSHKVEQVQEQVDLQEVTFSPRLLAAAFLLRYTCKKAAGRIRISA